MEEKLFLLVQVVFPAEPLNPARGIHQLLLAGKERVAAGTDFYLNILHCGSGFDDTATRTANRGRLILGMNFRLHFNTFSSS
jgi:hypothetical protein